MKIFSVLFLCIVPISVFSATTGWTDKNRTEMITGCVKGVKDTVVAEVRKENSLKNSDALPAEIQQALDTQLVPEFNKACTCAIEHLQAEYNYSATNNSEILKKTGSLIGSPTCPMNL